MNDSTNKLIETLKKQIEIRDDTIKSLTRENGVQSIIIKNQKRKHDKIIILVLSTLLIISSAITMYNILL